MTAVYFMVGVDFSEYSFMHIPHYLTEALKKAERNNVGWVFFLVATEAGREKLYEIYFF